MSKYRTYRDAAASGRDTVAHAADRRHRPLMRNDLRRLSEMFKALSNPNRLSIFLRLVSCCSPGTVCSADAKTGACVGEVGDHLGLSPSTISHHIKELYRVGLIRMERRGQNIDCCVDAEVLEKLAGFLGEAVACCVQSEPEG
jgi:ArsR family transcriptional regulator